MPYDVNEDLPQRVQNVLPDHAQDIYREAFNHAWDRYGQDEVRAHKIAWAAVKKEYEKGPGGKWVLKKKAA
ncbi:MAG: ChaB family protein [Actinobacteria bacterium]|nr:ChaB family protein [Actinomycetota bacterium]